jgi:pimeloyl-ACP methyl ester carboxylesterase
MEGAAGVPRVVHHAAAGDYTPFIESVAPGGRAQPAGGVAMGHFLSVTCSEDVDRIPLQDIPREIAHTFLGEYRIRQQRAACAHWPHARLSEEHFRQTRSNVPALFITGGADPVTGPRWAQALRALLPNSVSLDFPNGAHAPVANQCAIAAVVVFLDTADPRRVSGECAARVVRPPFEL